MAIQQRQQQQVNGVRVYYLGYLQHKSKPHFNIHVGDRPVMVKNMVGAFIDVPSEVHANEIVKTHRIVTPNGEFPAFTTDQRELFRIQKALQKKNEPTPDPVSVSRPLNRAELLKMLEELPDENAEDGMYMDEEQDNGN